MKIEQDLRIVIKAAAAASKQQDRSKTDRELIDEWMKRYPVSALAAKNILKKIDKAEAAKTAAKQSLAAFGLRPASWRERGDFDIDDRGLFVEAGGKMATKKIEFSDDQVIAEYAAAKTQKEADAVLLKYGIVWK